MFKGIKFRIYPNKEQKILINRTLGCCRLIYNKGLAARRDAHNNGTNINYYETSKMLTELKRTDEYSFLREVDAIALQQALLDLDRSYKNFFQKRTSYPVFKKKRSSRQSYRTSNQGNKIRIVGKYIRLPKVGFVKIKQTTDVGKIYNATVERTPTDKYYVVLGVEFQPTKMPKTNNKIGIDVGIKAFYSDSNGNIIQNPKFLEKSIKKIIREQQKLSRKQFGSNNWNKQRIKLAKIYKKISNQQNDFLQKESTKLVKENQIICIEDLDIKKLMHNNKLARNIGSVSWGKFFEMLTYKSIWYDRDIIRIPRTYPSTQLCSCCGYKNKLAKNLKVRLWQCPSCNTIHNRDVNASINILNEGLRIQSI